MLDRVGSERPDIAGQGAANFEMALQRFRDQAMAPGGVAGGSIAAGASSSSAVTSGQSPAASALRSTLDSFVGASNFLDSVTQNPDAFRAGLSGAAPGSAGADAPTGRGSGQAARPVAADGDVRAMIDELRRSTADNRQFNGFLLRVSSSSTFVSVILSMVAGTTQKLNTLLRG